MFKSEKFNERDLVKIDRKVREFIKKKKFETLQKTGGTPCDDLKANIDLNKLPSKKMGTLEPLPRTCSMKSPRDPFMNTLNNG